MRKHDFDNGRRDVLRVTVGLAGLAALNPKLQVWAQHVHQLAAPQGVGGGQGVDGSFRPLLDAGTPKFFSQAEMKTLAAVVEQIIPATETPGASGAGVHWYLDVVVETETELQARFRDGLRWLNATSQTRFQQDFADTTQENQAAVMELMMPEAAPGHEFFETLKAMTIAAYYGSEIGLHQELGWPRHVVKFEFIGCPHGGHSLDSMPRGRAYTPTPSGYQLASARTSSAKSGSLE